MNREIAWSVTQHFLIAIGGMALVDFIVTAHAYFVVVAVAGSGMTWAVLYNLEKGIRAKWLLDTETQLPDNSPEKILGNEASRKAERDTYGSI